VIGANGSGKSTLLRLVGGVGRPDEGHIEVTGRIGALLDLATGFHPDLNGWENAILGGIINGMTRAEVFSRLDEIVAFAEVGHAMENPLRTFSSGMQMRLAFSIAVHTEPSVLLIDEVMSVGDAAFQKKCLERIDAIKASGCSILLVSHDEGTIGEFCDKALWLEHGELVAQGRATEVVRQYAAKTGTAD
jgi:lipopolysaccharide transport system ATP-binding protein